MILTLSWRNIWRNKKRSLIIIVTIAFGMWAGLFSAALMNGMIRQKIEDDIATQFSHMQIHHKNFRERRDIDLIIPEGLKVLEGVMSTDSIKAASGRIILQGMATSATTAEGVVIYGVDQAQEMMVTNLSAKIVEGGYFESSKRNPAVIGKKLAEELGIKLNRKFVLTAQDMDGNISAGAFRVVGIYKTVSSMYDGLTVFTRREDLDRIFKLNGNIHEIAIITSDFHQVDTLAAMMSTEYPELAVDSWREISPELDYLFSVTDQANQIFMIIIMIALIFSLTNTMLMGVLERVRELGVVMALGMKHITIFIMIALETLMLAFVGGVTGILLTVASVEWLSSIGLDLSAFSTTMESFGYTAIVYPSLNLADYPPLVSLLFITAVAAAIYPGIKAIKLKPVEAIRTY